MVRQLALLTGAVALSVVLGACGDDGPATASSAAPGTPGTNLSVIAEDIRLSEPVYRSEAGPMTITYRNDGAIQHTLRIEGVDGFGLDVPANGDVDEGAVELEAGTYTLYCDVAGHREAGMEATLEVT